MAQRPYRRSADRPPRVGIVLGAGGVLGGAWMVGALAALERVTGWDPRSADYLLGTSAGAVFAALLAGGVPTSRLLPNDDKTEHWLLTDLVRGSSYKPAGRLPRLPLGSWRLALASARRQPSRWSLLRVLSGLVPTGRVSADPIARTIRNAVGRGWPAHTGCRITATDYVTGSRVIFGEPGAPKASLADAVAASCAIPGFFEPVAINGRRYVDGGLDSLCNLDLLADSDVDVVICFSAMTAPLPEPGARLLNRAIRFLLGDGAAELDRQAHALARRGVDVVVIEPTARDRTAMGSDLMDARPWAAVLKTAMSSVAAQLRRRHIGSRLGTLGAASKLIAEQTA